MGRFTDYQVGQWLDDFSTVWLALHFDNPDVAGANASEVGGMTSSYARQKCTMTQAANRVVFNSTAVRFTGLPAVGLTYVGGWDAQDGGNLLFFADLPTKITVTAGQSYSVPANTVALSFG